MISDKKLMRRAREKPQLVRKIFDIARFSIMERSEVRQLILKSAKLEYYLGCPCASVLELREKRFPSLLQQSILRYMEREMQGRTYHNEGFPQTA